MLCLILGLALFASSQAQFEPRIDFDKQYPRPTITEIAPFDLMLGKPPRIHIQIQQGPTVYICSGTEIALKRAGLAAGANVDISEQGKYIRIRRSGQRKWIKLRLVSKSELHNL